MLGARFESGLDNSPMYDGFFFDSETNLMQMYDVGMTSLVIQELESLVQLAVILDRPKAEILKLQDRADQLRNNVSEQLWDDAQGCFANRHRNGTFCTRITPTSFYPLLTNTVYGESQVASLLDHWLLNRSRFCIDPNWPQHRAKQNSDDCWWGLPSIAADDPAFPQLGYWRGFVWGPMAQIVYWSLENEQYSCLPSVAKARKSLSRQMAAMFMNMWRKHGNVCENFSPHKEVDNCTGDKFYHWGALGGLIILLEETGQIVHAGRFERGN